MLSAIKYLSATIKHFPSPFHAKFMKVCSDSEGPSSHLKQMSLGTLKLLTTAPKVDWLKLCSAENLDWPWQHDWVPKSRQNALLQASQTGDGGSSWLEISSVSYAYIFLDTWLCCSMLPHAINACSPSLPHELYPCGITSKWYICLHRTLWMQEPGLPELGFSILLF